MLAKLGQFVAGFGQFQRQARGKYAASVHGSRPVESGVSARARRRIIYS